jgi:hypothetical protein
MILDEAELPPSYLAEVKRLLSMIETAVDTAAVQDVGRYAEVVIRGFEVCRSLRASDIEELFVWIEAAIQMRVEYLAAQ